MFFGKEDFSPSFLNYELTVESSRDNIIMEEENENIILHIFHDKHKNMCIWTDGICFFRIPVHAGQSKQQEPILQSDACIFLHAPLIGQHCSAHHHSHQ